MSDGFVAHYTSPMTSDEIVESLNAFAAAGVVPENQSTGVVTILDDEGDQVTTDRNSLARTLATLQSGQRVTYQLWLSDSVDVICSYRRFGEDLAVRRYSLDGLRRDEAEAVIAAIASQLGRRTPETVAFAVDRRGGAAEIDLDAIVRERAHDDWPFPGDVVLIR